MSNDVRKLQTEFPDMSQSVLGDVLKTYSNDSKKASEALRGLSDQLRVENEAKIDELQELFPTLSRDIISQELLSVQGNVDSAIPPLCVRMEKIQQEEKKKRDDEQRKKREEEAIKKRKEDEKKQANGLMEIFRTIPKEQVQTLLEENEGDVEETTAALIELVAKQEEAAKKAAQLKAEEEEKKRKKEQDDRLRELKFQALRGKFEDLDDDQITAALQSNNWEIQKALGELSVVSIVKKREEIQKLFPSIEEELILETLESNNHDKLKTIKALTLEQEKRRLEEEASTAQDALEKETQKKKNRKQRAKKHNEEPAVIISKVKQNALARSQLLGPIIEKEIAANEENIIREEEKIKSDQRAAAQERFRNKLEHIINTQARDDTVPFTRKQIDNVLEEKPQPKPIVEVDTPAPVAIQEKELPTASQAPKGSQLDTKALVTLTVKQTIVDIKNPVAVDWEITSGVSSAWDWIGLFAANSTDKQYVTYQWSGKQLMKGTVTFSAPIVYGEYEFRYFPNGSYEPAAVSTRFKVGPQIELVGRLEKDKIFARWTQISGNLYSGSFIGLYEKSETNNHNYISWKYAGSKPNTDIEFDAPFKPRDYELRFFTNSYVDVARSQSIIIEGQDTMSASYENGVITVKLNIVSVDPYAESGWLGLYFVTETNNRQYRRCKGLRDRIGEVQFKAPKHGGEYEVRLFANKTYDSLLKSNSFTVPTTI